MGGRDREEGQEGGKKQGTTRPSVVVEHGHAHFERRHLELLEVKSRSLRCCCCCCCCCVVVLFTRISVWVLIRVMCCVLLRCDVM